MEISSASGSASLPQSLQLSSAQLKMMRKVTDIEGQGALQLIQSSPPLNVPDHVGQKLNVVA
jgi:hypothetical protein